MNNCKCCIPYVCAGSGCKQACKRHNIGAQCGATARNIVAQTTRNFDAKNSQQNQQNSQKSLRQLEVVSSPTNQEVNPSVEFPDNLVSYVEPDPYQNQPAAFVPSKVPRWRTPPYMNILIQEHHITPHMIKVNLMAKFNTIPDKDLNDIEKFLDIWTF